MDNRNEKILTELIKRPGNNHCADCGVKEVEYACYNIGIFVCGGCANVHVLMGSTVSKTKHLKLDHWEDSQIERLKQVGNHVSKQKYEARVPIPFRKPIHTYPPNQLSPVVHDHSVLVEHWIRSKYMTEEFLQQHGNNNEHQPLRPYLLGCMEGFLFKKGREDARYFPRRFVLDSTTLRYFVKDKSNPKAVIKLIHLDTLLCESKISFPYSLTFSYLKDGSTRHIFTYHDDPEVIMQWYQATRIAKFNALRVLANSINSVFINDTTMLSYMSEDVLMEGWLWKAGPSPSYAHRKRYFTLCNRKLMYHIDALDAYAKGEIFVGCCSNQDPGKELQNIAIANGLYNLDIKSINVAGYKVTVGGFGDDKIEPNRFVFSLHTPYRTFILAAETQSERDKWVTMLDFLIKIEINARDIATWSVLVRKRNGSMMSPLSSLLSSSTTI